MIRRLTLSRTRFPLGRAVLLTASALVFAALHPSRAEASEVRVSGTDLIFEATAGERNTVLVDEFLGFGMVGIRDSPNGPKPGLGCNPPDALGFVVCTGVTGRIKIQTGDEADVVGMRFSSFQRPFPFPLEVDLGAGSDRWLGSPGDDEVNGGDGDDRLRMSDAVDQLSGGAGFDIAEAPNPAFVGQSMGIGQGPIRGDIEGLVGSLGPDQLVGDGNANFLDGIGGNDDITGGGGRDGLNGGDGDDTLRSQDGEIDSVVCGPGNDTAFVDDFDDVNRPGFEDCENVVKPTAPVDFDWTVPDRFGGDADGNGLLDYFAPDGSLEIHPVGFRVDFTTGTTAGCDRTLSRTWSIDGVSVTASDPGVIFYDPNDCRFSFRFADEGTYEVELEVEAANGSLIGFKTHQVVVQDFLIVSLGDSVASGEGNPDQPQFGGPERWQNQQCHRSALAGPAQAAIRLEQADDKTSVTFVHLACSGATVDEGVLGSYEGIEPGAGTVLVLPPQVQEMQRLVGQREIDAVLISIGANDVQFSTLILLCFIRPNCDLLGPGSAASLFAKKILRLPGRYDRLDLVLSATQVPPERVYISEYFDPTRDGTGAFCDDILADHPFGGGRLQITADEARWASDNMLMRLNAEVFGATVRHGWRYVGGITSQFLTHGYCAPFNWVVTYTESILAQGDKNGTLHPNGPGHVAYAGPIAAGLKADLYQGGDPSKPRPPQ